MGQKIDFIDVICCIMVKKIWFLWYQGKCNMPRLVEECFNSWHRHNTEYDIIFLDKNNFSEHVEIESKILENKNITLQALSDIIRVNLLNQNGGVWVDATCYCMKPLNSWIENYFINGFFAFSKPTKDRLIASWFLVSNPTNLIIKKLADEVNSYWLKNPKMVRDDQLSFTKRYILGGILN